ncbi:hypothetical protein C0585_01510 [Candidatus Woesearchaeota archaeon]|nr:MAG: hypothetical protein C0585_01510 [Candidatus Woesearchaeota archaeon]
MLNINFIGKNRNLMKIQSLVLKNRYAGVKINIFTDLENIDADDGIYVVFSSIEEEFSNWIKNLKNKKIYLIFFAETDVFETSIIYNKILSKDSGEPLQTSIERGIKYFG